MIYADAASSNLLSKRVLPLVNKVYSGKYASVMDLAEDSATSQTTPKRENFYVRYIVQGFK